MSSIELAVMQKCVDDVPLIAAVAAELGAEAGESFARLRRWIHLGIAALEVSEAAVAQDFLQKALAESTTFCSLSSWQVRELR